MVKVPDYKFVSLNLLLNIVAGRFIMTKHLAAIITAAVVVIMVSSCEKSTPQAPTSKYLSPLSIIAADDGKTLYVAQVTAWSIAYVDIESGKVTKTVPIGADLNGLAISPDGKKLYVAAGAFNGKICIIDIETGKVKSTIKVGHSPIAPVVSLDGKTLYVCKRFNDNVLAIDLVSRKIIAEMPVIREPVAAVMTPDGKKLFVANFLPAGRVDGDFAAAAVTVIDTAENKTIATVTLPNGSIDLRGIIVSPDGKYVYVSHILARYQLPTTQLERGWMNTNAMTIVNTSDNTKLTTVLLDDVDLGAANPWGLDCTADGKYLCVAHSGTHEVSVIDRIAMHEKIDKVSKGQKVSDVSSKLEDIPNDLSFLVGIRKRIKLAGNGPRNLTMIGTKAYVCEYFTDSIGVVDIDPEIRPNAKSIALGPKVEMDVVRKGEMFFYDASLCFQKWQSCASCHPGDARPDALNWDLLNDGMGNPKNTKSLLFAHVTPPSMITGIRENAEVAVRAGIRFIQFAVRPEADAVAIDEYLKSLKPMPGPHLVNKRGKPVLSKAAERGKKIFTSSGCITCHAEPMFTDMNKYDVGTGKGREEGLEFDTPILIEVWRSAPYLHDGRAATMKDVLTEFNPNDRHGLTSGLSEKEIDELAEYIMSL